MHTWKDESFIGYLIRIRNHWVSRQSHDDGSSQRLCSSPFTNTLPPTTQPSRRGPEAGPTPSWAPEQTPICCQCGILHIGPLIWLQRSEEQQKSLQGKSRLSHKCFQVSYEERTASPSIHQQEKEGALDQSPLRRVTEVWLWQKATPSCCTPPPSGLCANTQHVGPPWVSWVSVMGWRGLTHHIRTPVSEIITNTHLFTGGRDGTGRICYSQCIRQISEREIC